MFQKIIKIAKRHKIVSIVIILLLALGGYYGYQKIKGDSGLISYITSAAGKETLIVSVNGSGQVQASDEVNLNAKASGEIIYVGVANGQEAAKGALLVKIDDQDARESLEDAEISYDQEKLTLDKMEGIQTDEGILRGTKEKAMDDLIKAYEDGFNNVADVFLDLPDIMSGLYDILFSYDFSSVQWNIDYYSDTVKIYDEKSLQYRDDAYEKYQTAKKNYDEAFQQYKNTNRFSDEELIRSLINETYETTKDVAEAIKSLNNLIQFYRDELLARNLKPQTIASSHLSELSTYTGKTNSFLLNLLSAKNTIQSDRETLIETGFDISDQEIKVKQAQNNLNNAQKKLDDYSIYAPFSGTVAEINVKKGDTVSSGTNVATMVTKQQIAEITFNEVDIAKIKLGQKVTLTFDAVENLTISGEVAEVDTVGTVTQGVVNYDVKIVFDTQDERVKPGMTVNASIITAVKQDALFVPNSAIKTENNAQYVETLVDNAPQRKPVETGLSNDTVTEIVSGLEQGELIITQTINVSSVSQTVPQSTGRNSGIRIPGL